MQESDFSSSDEDSHILSSISQTKKDRARLQATQSSSSSHSLQQILARQKQKRLARAGDEGSTGGLSCNEFSQRKMVRVEDDPPNVPHPGSQHTAMAPGGFGTRSQNVTSSSRERISNQAIQQSRISPLSNSRSSILHRPSQQAKKYYPLLYSEPLSAPEDIRQGHLVLPGCVARYLRAYQREGVSFLLHHASQERGAILADDMGLGKTCQLLCTLFAILRKDPRILHSSPTASGKMAMIVAPVSLLRQWVKDAETWGPFSTCVYHGKHRNELWDAIADNKYDIIITTYEMVQSEISKIKQLKLVAAVFDEGHKIKNTDTSSYKALSQVPCAVRFILTGTPLQNRQRELWALVDFVRKGYLGSHKDFKRDYTDPMASGMEASTSDKVAAKKNELATKLSSRLRSVLLRREKGQVMKQLPKKTDTVLFCKMQGLQEQVYMRAIRGEEAEAMRRSVDACDCGSGKLRIQCCFKHKDGVETKGLMFKTIHLLYKIANHVDLVRVKKQFNLNGLNYEQKRQYYDAIRSAETVLDSTDIYERSDVVKAADLSGSRKMEVLKQLLIAHLKQSHDDKVLLFFNSVQMMDIAEEYIKTIPDYKYRRFDGSIPAQKRWSIAEEYNKDPSIRLMLISTRAGGLGLNLTAANVVIVFDPNWNPAFDTQAQDRAFRIGQTRDVQVYRLIASGTIEEAIYARQVFKQTFANSTLKAAKTGRFFDGIEGRRDGDLFGRKNLFAYHPEKVRHSFENFMRKEIEFLGNQSDTEGESASNSSGVAGRSQSLYFARAMPQPLDSQSGAGSESRTAAKSFHPGDANFEVSDLGQLLDLDEANGNCKARRSAIPAGSGIEMGSKVAAVQGLQAQGLIATAHTHDSTLKQSERETVIFQRYNESKLQGGSQSNRPPAVQPVSGLEQSSLQVSASHPNHKVSISSENGHVLGAQVVDSDEDELQSGEAVGCDSMHPIDEISTLPETQTEECTQTMGVGQCNSDGFREQGPVRADDMALVNAFIDFCNGARLDPSDVAKDVQRSTGLVWNISEVYKQVLERWRRYQLSN